MDKLVSVVIPTYNREDTIIRTINSILSQSYQNIEIIVCDDFSTDHTVDRVKGISEIYSNVTIVSRKDGIKGANAARNLGITMAKGEYIAFCDSDDMLVDESISNRVKVLDENPEIDMVYGDYIIDGKLSPFDKIQNFDQHKYIMQELSLCGFIAIMLRKRVFDVCPLLDNNLKSGQDDGLVIELDRCNMKMFHCGFAVAEVGNASNNITSNNWNLYEGLKYRVSLYKTDIIKETSIFRYFLWKMRILLDYFRAKRQSSVNEKIEWWYEKAFQLLLFILKPFYRHIWG